MHLHVGYEEVRKPILPGKRIIGQLFRDKWAAQSKLRGWSVLGPSGALLYWLSLLKNDESCLYAR